MSKRYFIYFSYNGAAYHGWQIQPNGISVQEVLTKGISTILRKNVELVGAGRTDAGVHARWMVAHFDVDGGLESASHLTNKLNSYLPNDIAVYKIVPVIESAHARFDATFRRYEYHVTTQKSVFIPHLATRISDNLDFEKMNEAASSLLEYRDFTSFSKLHTDALTNNCTITHAEWTQQGDKWVFTIQADRFLRNMVRAIVGTLWEVGRGKISIADFRAIIESENRCKAGASVPAHGLFLVDIGYPDRLFG